jgi:hypothetical protein
MATKDKKQGEPAPAQDDPSEDAEQGTDQPDQNLVVLAAPEGLLTVSHDGQTYEVKDGLVAVLPEHMNYLINFMECRRL